MPEDLRYLVNAEGEIKAVQLSVSLWKRVEELVKPFLVKPIEQIVQQPGPLKDFETFLEYWDFPYPYSPKVSCPHCGAATEDWQNDESKQFVLTNASLGGLLVFHCLSCGTTIRHKHFRDHVSYEHTTPIKKS